MRPFEQNLKHTSPRIRRSAGFKGIYVRAQTYSRGICVVKTMAVQLERMRVYLSRLHGALLLIKCIPRIISTGQCATVRPSVEREHEPASYGSASTDTVESAES